MRRQCQASRPAKAVGKARKKARGAGKPSASKPPGKARSAPRPGEAKSPGSHPSSSGAPSGRFPIVGIGASAGGLEAFRRFFQAMTDNLGAAFVIVPHLDPTRESLEAELLSRYTKMKVVEAEDGVRVEPDRVYVIPPDREMSFLDGELLLSRPSQRRGLRMPIDIFLRSLGEEHRELAIAIILSGTGSDGSQGVRTVKGSGGMVMAQEPESAQYDGMPWSAISTGAVDFVLPPEEMPAALQRFLEHIRDRAPAGEGPPLEKAPTGVEPVLSLLHVQTGHNFRGYKRNTLGRRITRRMSLIQVDNIDDYVSYLRKNVDEVKQLFRDLLIGVTGFFREPESWESLEKEALPRLVESTEPGTVLRAWVPGCATGEEAYTLAILMAEATARAGREKSVDLGFQVFATDIDAASIETARAGKYIESVVSDVGAERLEHYFEREDGVYRVGRPIRDSVIFSVQDLVADPPFSKLDIVSCRNLLIYLEANTQERILRLFHFALKDNGLLTLGSSETIGPLAELFEPLSRKLRIYRRKTLARRDRVEFPLLQRDRVEDSFPAPTKQSVNRAINVGDLMRHALLEDFAPGSVVINPLHEVLYFFGPMDRYILQRTGEPTTDLMALLREGLVSRVRGAVKKVTRDGEPVELRRVRMKGETSYLPVRIDVRLLPIRGSKEGLILVSFRDEPESPDLAADRGAWSPPEESLLRQLEDELKATKEELQNTVEEMEAANEELKASNEEIMSMNEELQSSNEELETSKEELQSLNEELNTVNAELQEKVSDLEVLSNDLINFLASTDIATVFLDGNRKIKRFTPASKKLFSLLASDVGRPITDIAARFRDDTLAADISRVLEELTLIRKRVNSEDGQWYLRSIRPYRTQDDRIEGVVITFQDLADLRSQGEEPPDAQDVAAGAHTPGRPGGKDRG